MQRKINNIPVNDNLKGGDCGLWFDVFVFDGKKFKHCVCPYDRCKTYEDAVKFYYDHYHRNQYEPVRVQHHKIPARILPILAKAC